MLYIVHDTPVPVPARLVGQTRTITDRLALADLASGDVLLWGTPPAALRLEGLAPGRLLLGLCEATVSRARQFGWPRAFVLPDLEPETLELALRPERNLLPVGTGTLVLETGVLWREGHSVRLGRQERLLLERLVAARGEHVPRAQLREALGMSDDAVAGGIRRLRARIGPDNLVCERGSGWRLRPPPAPALELEPEPPKRLGGLTLDGTGRLWLDGAATDLGPREGAILELLFEARGGLVRRAEVAKRLAPITPAGVDTLIHRLRKKLGTERLVTVRGTGWRLADIASHEPDPPSPEAPPDAGAIARLLDEHPLVCVTGPPGSDRSSLLRAVGQRLRLPVLDASGMEPDRALRWVSRRHEPVAVLDGLDDARTVRGEIDAMIASGRRLLLGAHTPTGHPGEHVVALQGPPEPDLEHVRANLAARPALRGPLVALRAFVGPFDAEDARKVTGVDPEDLVYRNLIVRQDGGFVLAPAVGRALDDAPDGTTLERWAHRTVETSRAALFARPCRQRELAMRAADLDAAVAYLSERQDPAAVRAAILWSHTRHLLGLRTPSARLVAVRDLPMPDRTRAELLVEMAQAEDIDFATVSELLARALALPASATTRWMARMLMLIRDCDLDPHGRRERVAALRREMDEADEPCSPDVRAAVDLIWSLRAESPEEQHDRLTAALGRLEQSRWRAHEVADVWMQEARSCLLTELGDALSKLGELSAAEGALTEAESLAPANAANLVRFRRALIIARQDRWEEADALLEQAAFSPCYHDRPAMQAHILGWRGLVAATAGRRGLAETLVTQVEWLSEKTGFQGGLRAAAQIRAWMAMEDGLLERTRELAHTGWPDTPHVSDALVEVARTLGGGQPDPTRLSHLLAALRSNDPCDLAGGLARVLDTHARRYPSPLVAPISTRSNTRTCTRARRLPSTPPRSRS